MNGSITLEVEDLRKQYSMTHERLVILDGVSFTASAGELIAVMGPSGSGKTSLISLLAGLDPDFGGAIRVCGYELKSLRRSERVDLRCSAIGMVFQDHRLLPQLSALENVEAPLHLRSYSRAERESRAMNALQLVGLADRARHRPGQLSGGERQRTAIARAIVTGASVLLCDEPTGSLNREMSQQIFGLLAEICHKFNKTVVLSTHDHAAIRFVDRLLQFEGGQLREVTLNEEASRVAASGS
jgi:ABC-type lipoprotein export system ATPase subunit